MSWKTKLKFQKAVLSNDILLAQTVIDQINTNSYFQHQQELPLHLSIKYGHLAMVEFLLRNGADVNMLNRHGIYPLHYACMFVHPQIARLLIDVGANLDAYSITGQTPLLIAVNSNSLELVKILVEAGADIELKDCPDGYTPLHLACRHHATKDTLLIEYLISKGANICTENRAGFTPLMTAIVTNYNINIRMVKLLLRNGADPNQANRYGISPLLATVRRSSDHFEEGSATVQLLIDYGCHVNDREFRGQQFLGDTALNIAIDRNQDSITEKLIRHGADVNVKNLRGETPVISLLRDRKYGLARQALATTAMICQDDFHNENIRRYLLEEYHMNEDPENTKQLKQFLFEQWPFFPRLMHLCRCSLRRWLGRYADQSIQKLSFPKTIKMYLLLKQL